jgi:hypothetical protein
MRTLPLRTSLFVAAVVAMVLVYLFWWTTYVGIHFDERYAQRPAGAVGEVGGTTIRLLSLTRSAMLADQKYGDVPEQASPGTTWVVAEFEAVQRQGAPSFSCTFKLLGPDGREWSQQSFLTKRTVPSCSPTAIQSGTPVRFEEVFLVPERFADRLAGVAVLDPSTADRSPVVLPPA